MPATTRTNSMKLLSTDLDYRKLAAANAAAGTLFWFYTFYVIGHLPLGDGTGLQWLAAVPLATIFAMFFLPAWILVAIGRFPRVALALGVCGLIAFVVVWAELLAEIAKAQHH
jgi:hypothetical protein